MCEYSGTSEAVIKGNSGSDGQKIYHVPGSQYYGRTVINESGGERWFCAVKEASAAGWRAPSRSVASPSPTPTRRPTPTRTPTPTATTGSDVSSASSANVQIACIFFDGEVPRTEADEDVEIVNASDAAQDMTGWKLMDASGSPDLVLTALALEPGGVVRVYTNQEHPEWGGLSFGSGRAIWSNTNPDIAELYDASGELVSSMSYDPERPPGCR